MQTDNENITHLRSLSVLTMQLYEHLNAASFDHGSIRIELENSGALSLIIGLIKEQTETINRLARKSVHSKINADHGTKLIEEALSEMAKSFEPEKARIINDVCTNAAAVRKLLESMEKFPADQLELSPGEFQQLLKANTGEGQRFSNYLHWRSPALRFAFRLGILLTIAYWSLFFVSQNPFNYWFLLTIIVVSRPRLAITWQRNVQRLSGTLAGLSIAYVLTKYIHSVPVLMTIAAGCLFVFYGWVRKRYDLSVLAVTVFAVIVAGIYRGESQGILTARLIYTIAGCALAVGGIFLFPLWINSEIKELAKASITGNRMLLAAVVTNKAEVYLRVARKEAHLRLARLAEGLQHARMEPAHQNLSTYNNMLLLNYRLNAVILSTFLSEKPGLDRRILNEALAILQHAEATFKSTNGLHGLKDDDSSDLVVILSREILCIAQADDDK